MRQLKAEQLEIISFFLFPSWLTVRVDLYAFVIEYDDSFFCSNFFTTSMRYSITIPISALAANAWWQRSNILYVLQGHVRRYRFLLDGVTKWGFGPQLLFTVCMYSSKDAAFVMAPGSSSNFLAFQKYVRRFLPGYQISKST